MESAAQRQMMRDPALAAGVTDYINPVMQSNGKALSQNANWAAANKLPLTARQQAMMDAVDKLAKPIGQETTLYRADHDDFLKRLKVNNYQSMSDSQLRKALVGKTWTNDCLESTAYDSRDNPLLAAARRQPQCRQAWAGRLRFRQPEAKMLFLITTGATARNGPRASTS